MYICECVYTYIYIYIYIYTERVCIKRTTDDVVILFLRNRTDSSLLINNAMLPMTLTKC